MHSLTCMLCMHGPESTQGHAVYILEEPGLLLDSNVQVNRHNRDPKAICTIMLVDNKSSHAFSHAKYQRITMNL
jgi:hypothetical protein